MVEPNEREGEVGLSSMDIDETVQTEVLIVGAGAAGIRTALALKAEGVDALLVSDREHGDAHTRFAAGGINATLRTHDPDDRWQIHAADTLREGHFINDPEAVRQGVAGQHPVQRGERGSVAVGPTACGRGSCGDPEGAG